MTREQEINNAASKYIEENSMADGYVSVSDYKDSFIEGAEWSDANPKSPWISVDEDLPCNHEELISLDDKIDTLYVVAVIHGIIILSRMYKFEGKWSWENDEPTHWMPIPKLPKE